MHTDGKRDSHDGGQLFRNRAHRQGHGSIEHLFRTAAADQTHRKSEPRQCHHHLQQRAAEARKLARQRRGECGLLLQRTGDLAHFRGVSRGHHHTKALTRRHERARVGHPDALSKRSIGLNCRSALCHRQRFSGEGRLIDVQIAPADQTQISRNLGARLQAHQITGHQRR